MSVAAGTSEMRNKYQTPSVLSCISASLRIWALAGFSLWLLPPGLCWTAHADSPRVTAVHYVAIPWTVTVVIEIQTWPGPCLSDIVFV